MYTVMTATLLQTNWSGGVNSDPYHHITHTHTTHTHTHTEEGDLHVDLIVVSKDEVATHSSGCEVMEGTGLPSHYHHCPSQ